MKKLALDKMRQELLSTTKAEGGSVEDDYRSEHTAPSPDFGAPMHDVTRDMYPKDFYGPNGFRYYADFGEHHDREAYDKVRRVKDRPNEMVSIHRAIPTSVYKEALKKDAPLKHMIRKGDWVAISKDYAKEHGQAVLQGDFKIASMRVPAKHVWTNADSIHEWGYHPVEEKAKGGSIDMSEQVNHVPQKGVPSIGINVATDKDMRYADLIVDGKKRYESRNSDSLRPWVGKRVSIVRTGEGKAKAIGAATLGEPLVVDASKFRAMQEQHLVPPGSKFDIKAGVKYLYPVNDPERFDKEHDVGHGIVARRVTQTMADGGTPKKTVTAYKLFRVDPKHPGKLFPLFVNANKPVETGKWIDAEEGSKSKTGKVKSKLGDLAYRPGWHSGDVPIATHIGDKDEEQKAEAARIEELRKATAAKLGNDKKAKEAANKKHPYPDWVSAPRLRSPNHLWAEVSLPDDVNWQEEATKRGINKKGKVIAKNAHITDQIPKGGNYRYKTNPNMTGNWLISGSMKVNRVLPDEEVERINKEAGVKDLPRENPMDLKKFGFAQGGPTIDQMRYQLQKRKG